MDRGTWWATVHGVARIRHSLVTKPPPYIYINSTVGPRNVFLERCVFIIDIV